VLVIAIPFGLPMGIKLLILVILYNVLAVIIGVWLDDREWIYIWIFSIIISIFQVFPDWFLSAELNILVFPDDGLIKIGTVSGYMLGLWAIPLFIILYVGQRVQDRQSKKLAYIIVGLMSLIIFGTSENTIWMLESWYAQNVFMIGHLAIYIIIPELILGLMTYYGYELIKENNNLMKIPVAFVIMLLYLGSAAFFYFLIEKVFLA
jgi:hypothetical protein